MGNAALDNNPTTSLIDLTVQGSDFLWWLFAMMLASGLGVTAWAFTLNAGHRAFHFLGVAILFTASVAYFSLASDLGSTPIPVEFVRRNADLYTGAATDPTRSIWYVRYIDWVITTPLLLLTLLLGTGLPLSHIFFTVFMDEVMIITGLVGALVHSSYKWGYFTFGCVAMFYVFWVLVGPARTAAKAIGDDNHKAYVRGALTLSFLWLLYPVAWGLADGGNVISTDAEMIFYGVLDFLAKPCFVFLHLFALKGIDYDRFGLQSGHFTETAVGNNSNGGYANGNGNGTGASSAVRGEKAGMHHRGANGAGNGNGAQTTEVGTGANGGLEPAIETV